MWRRVVVVVVALSGRAPLAGRGRRIFCVFLFVSLCAFLSIHLALLIRACFSSVSINLAAPFFLSLLPCFCLSNFLSFLFVLHLPIFIYFSIHFYFALCLSFLCFFIFISAFQSLPLFSIIPHLPGESCKILWELFSSSSSPSFLLGGLLNVSCHCRASTVRKNARKNAK